MSSAINSAEYFDQLIGKEINRTYRIEEKLGSGGMGAVFRASHLTLGNRVAIKIISPELATNKIFIKRFQREARVGWTLSHPNIIKVFESGETEDDLLFMVMEFVEGETLSKYLHTVKRVTAKEAIEVIKPLCEALDAAHKHNLLHRDLKPANILISNNENQRIVKLADFGIVKLMQPDSQITDGANLTALGEVFGTPQYMSPEQLVGQEVSTTTDIYSLGVIVYEMLTGELPIFSKDLRELFVRKMNKDLPWPSKKFPFIPRAFDAVLLKAIAKDPEDRYQTVCEFLQDFEQLANKYPSWDTAKTARDDDENSAAPTLIRTPMSPTLASDPSPLTDKINQNTRKNIKTSDLAADLETVINIKSELKTTGNIGFTSDTKPLATPTAPNIKLSESASGDPITSVNPIVSGSLASKFYLIFGAIAFLILIIAALFFKFK